MSGTVTTSPAAGYSAGVLSDQEKADCRRFMWYPPYGAGATGFEGWRFFQAYGTMEYRFNNMAAAEYQNIRYLLATCYSLEQALPAAGATLNVSVAAAFTRNPAEMAERRALLTEWRMKLVEAVGVPPGPQKPMPGKITI